MSILGDDRFLSTSVQTLHFYGAKIKRVFASPPLFYRHQKLNNMQSFVSASI
jgi:hypothetical protein